jgi:predicted S18 family serine protease
MYPVFDLPRIAMAMMVQPVENAYHIMSHVCPIHHSLSKYSIKFLTAAAPVSHMATYTLPVPSFSTLTPHTTNIKLMSG